MSPGVRPLVAGNWKMNGLIASLGEIEAMRRAADAGEAGAAELAVCPPFTLLARAACELKGGKLSLGAQDCHAEPERRPYRRHFRLHAQGRGRGLCHRRPFRATHHASRERRNRARQGDAVLALPDGSRRIIEVDEAQHFNGYRATTLFRYSEVRTAFPLRRWLKFCGDVKREPGGGFAVPRPPLFPDHGGRHRQRAFRDALCDILPALYGFEPTLRIACFEVAPWIDKPGAKRRMTELLRRQGVLPRRTSHRLVRVRPQSEVARKSS